MNINAYARAIGSIMYDRIRSRPDISHVVSVPNKFMRNPRMDRWKAFKWILKYLKGIQDLCMVFIIYTTNPMFCGF